MTGLVTGLLALTLVVALLAAGRRDLSHPAVVFGVVWFACVAAAQLRLTSFHSEWSVGFAALAIGGGLALVATATLAAGTGTLRAGPPPLASVDTRRLLVIAGVLILGALGGLAWKASILGGVPLFSDNIDLLRNRAYGADGGSRVPAPSTFLTNGFHLALWCVLLVAALRWRGWSWTGRAGAALVAGACLVGVFAGGSRNGVMFAIAIPLFVAYLCSARLPRRGGVAIAGVLVVLVAFASIVFAARISQRTVGESFYSRAADEQPAVVRPLLPMYIAGTYSLETYRRAFEAFPERFAYAGGGYELSSLPDAAFPRGKPTGGTVFGRLSYDGPTEAYWTVASYQGRAYADFGWPGVPLVSVVLGTLLGGVYRIAREHRTIVTLVAAACGVYVAALLVYDNLLSFSLAVVYDLAVVALAARLATTRSSA